MGLFIRLYISCLYYVSQYCNYYKFCNIFFTNYVDHVTNGPLLFTNGNIYITISNANVCVCIYIYIYITHRVSHIVKLCCTIYFKYLNKLKYYLNEKLINKVSTNLKEIFIIYFKSFYIYLNLYSFNKIIALQNVH